MNPPENNTSPASQSLAAKMTPWVTFISILFVPLIVCWVAKISEQGKTDIEYVRLAINILQPSPDGKTVSSKELREWAVSVIKQTSKVKFPEAAANALIESKIDLPEWGEYTGGSGSSYYYDTPSYGYSYDYISEFSETDKPMHSKSKNKNAPQYQNNHATREEKQ